MGRPPLPVGSYGKITSVYVTPKIARARARFRDYNGQVSTIERTGQTKTAAENALRAALADRERAGAAGVIAPSTTVAALADLWLAADHDWATNTRETYGYIIENQIKPGLGGIRLSELSLTVINRSLRKVKDTNGPGAAKTMKSALSGMCKLAISYEAMDSNPTRDAISLGRGKAHRKDVRALTPDETDRLCDGLRALDRAAELDLPDLVEWMLATGCRIGEACAARDAVLDLDTGTWEINATVVRIKGLGLVVQERPKTAAGWRRLALPPFAVAMIKRRAAEQRLRTLEAVIFGAPKAKALRDPSNTAGDLREVLDALGFHWVTSHVFRKTVATRLDQAGQSARVIADQLGHAKPSMTQDVYMGRKVVSADAARILDR
jgi:integrase